MDIFNKKIIIDEEAAKRIIQVKKCLWDENDYKPCELKAMDCDNCDYYGTENDIDQECIDNLKSKGIDLYEKL